MRAFWLTILALLSTSQAVTLVDTKYAINANPAQGFQLLAWFTLKADFPKDTRLVLAQFGCNTGKNGTLQIRHLNLPDYVWGDTEDEEAISAQVMTPAGLHASGVTASCASGRLKVQFQDLAAMRAALPYFEEDTDTLALRRSLGISRDVTFSERGLMYFNLPVVLQGGQLSAPETPAGVAVGVTQGSSGVQAVALGAKSTPVSVRAGLPYTLHYVIAGQWYNLQLDDATLTGWMGQSK